MNLNVRVAYLGNEISLYDALNNGYVKIVDSRIEYNDNIILSMSTKLYDWNNKEIFENDIVKDYKGNMYLISYNFGMFYFADLESKDIIAPISIYKLNNTIDVEIIK